MKIALKSGILTLVIVFALTTTGTLSAAIILPQITTPSLNTPSDSLQMTIWPQYPAPGETVKATLSDTLADLNRTDISWTLNGKIVQEGVGIQTFSFVAGASGTSQVLSVRGVQSDGSTISKSATIIPASVDLIWQARSYVPPFYKGKALFPNQGIVTVNAIPSFGNGSSKDYVYTWSMNDSPDQADSGYQKSSVNVVGQVLMQPITVSVTVSTFDGSISGTASVTLNSIAPSNLLYENNPLYGVLLNRSLSGGFTLKEQEVGLIAEPFFFSTNGPHVPDVGYEWMVNGAVASNSTTQNSLTLRAPSNSTGNSQVSVKLISPDAILQSITTDTTVSYSQK